MSNNSQLLVDIGQGLSLAIGLPTLATWNTKNRPHNAKRGTFGFNTETNCLELYDGEEWYQAQMKGIQ